MHKLIYFFLLPSFLVTKPLSDQKTPVTPLVSEWRKCTLFCVSSL